MAAETSEAFDDAAAAEPTPETACVEMPSGAEAGDAEAVASPAAPKDGAAGPQGSKAKVRVSHLPKNPVPDLQFLTFYSWWTELNTKRYMEICFDMKTELFRVVVDKDVQHLHSDLLFNPTTESLHEVTAKDTKVMSMHLHEKLSGNQHAESLRRNHLTQWDLHVGARLNILGRPTTLMQCNLLTAKWLEYQTDRLTRIKGALEEQLRKYETIPILAVFATKPSDSKRLGGNVDLRFLLNMIQGLQQRLARYRPNVAAAFAELLGSE